MSADNYVQVQEVTVHYFDTGPTKEWWAWDCSMSAEYLYHKNELYLVDMRDISCICGDRDASLHRVKKHIFPTEKAFDDWVDSFAVLEYGVNSMPDIEIYRSS